MYMLDLQAIGLIITGGAAVGLVVGLMAGLMLRGGEEPSPPKRGLTRVLTLWRRKTDAALWVHLDEQVAASPDDLEEEERAALGQLLVEMYRWLRQEESAAWPPPAAEAPSSGQGAAVQAAPAIPQAAAPPPTAPAEGAQVPSGTPPSSTAPPAHQPSLNPLKSFQDAFRARKQASNPPPLPSGSIAAQVDEILQEMLAGTALEKRGIRLMELPGQGMVVMVGLEKFAAVEDVPYDEVRKVLKIAVTRWERKMLGE